MIYAIGFGIIFIAILFAVVYWARQEAEIQQLEEEIKSYESDTEADYT